MTDGQIEILKAIGMVIGGAIIYIAPKVEKYFSKRGFRSSFGKSIELSNQIIKILDEVRITLNASRVNIMDYHNGKNSYNGIPFQYVTMFAESCNTLVAPVIGQIQSIPINPAIPVLLKVDKSANGYIRSTDEDEDEAIAILQKSFGCMTSYTFKMGEEIVDGSLVISWHNDYETLKPAEIIYIKSCILRINTIRKQIKKH